MAYTVRFIHNDYYKLNYVCKCPKTTYNFLHRKKNTPFSIFVFTALSSPVNPAVIPRVC